MYLNFNLVNTFNSIFVTILAHRPWDLGEYKRVFIFRAGQVFAGCVVRREVDDMEYASAPRTPLPKSCHFYYNKGR